MTVHEWLDVAFIAAGVVAVLAPDRRPWQMALGAMAMAAVSAAFLALGSGFLAGVSVVVAGVALWCALGLERKRRNHARSARGGSDPQA